MPRSLPRANDSVTCPDPAYPRFRALFLSRSRDACQGRRFAARPGARLRRALAPVLALALAGFLAGKSLAADELVGRPRVVDGDTLDFSGQVVRLAGIDSPEVDQTCRADGLAWPCGQEARWAALNRVGRHWVTCVPRARVADGGLTAVCYLAGRGQQDLNAWLVRRGWALAERGAEPGAEPGAAKDYLAEERAAQAEGAGIWRGAFIAPWDWRRGRRLPR